MAEEVRIKVILETGQAEAQLDDYVRKSEETSGRISSTFGKRLKQAAALTGAGTALAAVRSSTGSGIGDLVGETTGRIGQQLNDFFLGDLDDKARAARDAREETIAAFGAATGASGSIPDGAKQFFDSVRSINQLQEEGRSRIQGDSRFQADGISALFDRIADKIAELLSAAVNELAERLNPVR